MRRNSNAIIIRKKKKKKFEQIHFSYKAQIRHQRDLHEDGHAKTEIYKVVLPLEAKISVAKALTDWGP